MGISWWTAPIMSSDDVSSPMAPLPKREFNSSVIDSQTIDSPTGFEADFEVFAEAGVQRAKSDMSELANVNPQLSPRAPRTPAERIAAARERARPRSLSEDQAFKDRHRGTRAISADAVLHREELRKSIDFESAPPSTRQESSRRRLPSIGNPVS